MRLINADALINHIVKKYGRTEIILDIDEASTVEAEPVIHGKWISHGSYFTCSVCDEMQFGIDTGRYYCQNCGAKMDEVNE